jgi:transposase InsO family protein
MVESPAQSGRIRTLIHPGPIAGVHVTYTPRTNGKAERFIQTLCKEWAYAMAFQNSQERDHWLPRYLSIYNRLRKHSALGGRSPQQRLNELLC